jgi:hypothetical protein
MSPGHFAPAARRTPRSVSPIACRGFPCGFPAAAYAFGNCRLAAASTRRREADLSIGTNEVLVTARTSFPGRRSPCWQEKAVVFPLPLLGLPGATRLVPCWGLVSAEPEDGTHAALRARRCSAENIRNFPFERASTGACCWRSPAARCPQGQAASRVRGEAPAAPSPPPRRPGPRSASATGQAEPPAPGRRSEPVSLRPGRTRSAGRGSAPR